MVSAIFILAGMEIIERGDWTLASDLIVPSDARCQLRHTPLICSFAKQSIGAETLDSATPRRMLTT